jgi:hypothetical protein
VGNVKNSYTHLGFSAKGGSACGRSPQNPQTNKKIVDKAALMPIMNNANIVDFRNWALKIAS